jgi:hypothetical protein
MAEEKWFQFVGRMKREQNLDSLADAMKYASAHKDKWQKGGNPTAEPIADVKKGGKKGKGKTRKNKTGSRRKM